MRKGEIFERVWEAEELALLNSSQPSAGERALLDQELDEYRANPAAGSSWVEVEARLRKSNQ